MTNKPYLLTFVREDYAQQFTCKIMMRYMAERTTHTRIFEIVEIDGKGFTIARAEVAEPQAREDFGGMIDMVIVAEPTGAWRYVSRLEKP